MAICGNCGIETARVRSRWTDKGVQMPDECPSCAPQQFEAFKSVRDGQIAMGWEYMPNMYVHTEDGYVPKDELLADTEAEVLKRPEEDVIAEREAIEKKRANRRTKPMTGSEISQAIARWNNMQIQ